MYEFAFLLLLAIPLNYIILFVIKLFFQTLDFLKDWKLNLTKIKIHYLFTKKFLITLTIFILFILLLYFHMAITIIFSIFYMIYFFTLRFLVSRKIDKGNTVFILSIIMFLIMVLILRIWVPTIFLKGKIVPEMWLFHITNATVYDFLKVGSKLGIKFDEFNSIFKLSLFIKENLVGFIFLLSLIITTVFFKHLKKIINFILPENDDFYLFKIPKEIFFISIILLLFAKIFSIESLVITIYGVYFLSGYSLIIYCLKGGRLILNLLVFFIALIIPIISIVLVIIGFLDGIFDLRKVLGLFRG